MILYISNNNLPFQQFFFFKSSQCKLLKNPKTWCAPFLTDSNVQLTWCSVRRSILFRHIVMNIHEATCLDVHGRSIRSVVGSSYSTRGHLRKTPELCWTAFNFFKCSKFKLNSWDSGTSDFSWGPWIWIYWNGPLPPSCLREFQFLDDYLSLLTVMVTCWSVNLALGIGLVSCYTKSH